MSFEVVPIPEFVKELKWLAKKYRTLTKEVDALGDRLALDPQTGSPPGRVRAGLKGLAG